MGDDLMSKRMGAVADRRRGQDGLVGPESHASDGTNQIIYLRIWSN